jgi:hypothetical protein
MSVMTLTHHGGSSAAGPGQAGVIGHSLAVCPGVHRHHRLAGRDRDPGPRAQLAGRPVTVTRSHTELASAP